MLNTRQNITDSSSFMFVNGSANFSPYFINERNAYTNYKQNKNFFVMPKSQEHMQILEMLEQLGFSMAEVGTYYFKELIIRIVELLNQGLLSEDQISDFLEQPFSQLYFDVARNDLDIGIKSFNEYVNFAFGEIDINNANQELLDKIIEKMDTAVSNRQLPLVIAQEFRLTPDFATRTIHFPSEK